MTLPLIIVTGLSPAQSWSLIVLLITVIGGIGAMLHPRTAEHEQLPPSPAAPQQRTEHLYDWARHGL